MHVIYKLNFANGDFYIGQTAHINTRIKHHLNNYGKGSPKLENAFLNSEYIGYDILEVCDQSSIDSKEMYWITELKPVLNTLPGGKVLRGINHPRSKYTEGQILEVIDLLLNSQASYQDISVLTDVPISTVRDICFLRSHLWATEDKVKQMNKARQIREKLWIVYSPDNTRYEITCAVAFAKAHSLPTGFINRLFSSKKGYSQGWSTYLKTPISFRDPLEQIHNFTSIEEAKEYLRTQELPQASVKRLLQGKSTLGWSQA